MRAENERKEQVEALREQTSGELRQLVKELRKTIAAMRDQFGVKLEQGPLLALMDHLQHFAERDQVCYVAISQLSEWLSKYDDLGLDPHCRISIDPYCIGKDYPGGFEVRALEVTLFEDMASLFNMARQAHIETATHHECSKVALKRAAALYRSTVSAAFYFVECFMNEVAADYVWRHRLELSANDLTTLTEWEEQRQRSKFVSTRDKLVLYPRIVTGSRYPPLDEGNCPELKFIVTKAKDFRDALVHASTAKKNAEGEYDKELAIIRLKYESVEEIVDAAVTLIRKIQVAIGKSDEFRWLIGRAADGFFSASVFD